MDFKEIFKNLSPEEKMNIVATLTQAAMPRYDSLASKTLKTERLLIYLKM